MFKKRCQDWYFPDSYLSFLTAFSKRKKSIVIRKKSIVIRKKSIAVRKKEFLSEKKYCYKKKSIVIRNVDHMSVANLTFYVTSP